MYMCFCYGAFGREPCSWACRNWTSRVFYSEMKWTWQVRVLWGLTVKLRYCLIIQHLSTWVPD